MENSFSLTSRATPMAERHPGPQSKSNMYCMAKAIYSIYIHSGEYYMHQSIFFLDRCGVATGRKDSACTSSIFSFRPLVSSNDITSLPCLSLIYLRFSLHWVIYHRIFSNFMPFAQKHATATRSIGIRTCGYLYEEDI